MIHLTEVAYVRLGTADRSSANTFIQDIIGLQLSDKSSRTTHFRSDAKAHSLCLFDGDPKDQTVAFKIETAEELDAAGAALEDAEIAVHRGSKEECLERQVHDFIGFKDPSGNKIEIALRAQVSGQDFIPSRDVDITGFNHVGLFSTNTVRDEAFWTKVCNARVSDRIGPVPLMRFSAMHHEIALAPAEHSGIHHINHQVADIEDVMRSLYFLKKHDVEIVFGPGRHPLSGARFVYFRGPDNVVYEYSVGVNMIENEEAHRPRQFNPEPWSICMWGALWAEPQP